MEKNNLIKTIVTVVVLIAILFLYWKFDYSKNSKTIAQLKAENDKLNTQVNEARKVAASYAEYSKRLKILENQLKIANKMLPDSQLLEDALDTLTVYANKNNVKIMNIKPLSVSVTNDYANLNHEITLNATYSSLGQFLTDMGNQKRITKVNSIAIKPLKTTDENLNTIQVVLTMSTYYKGPGAQTKTEEGKNVKKKK
uniref:Pilus assembly protein PilO n=1 Tax=candidate division WOR-3 bacterium TaxID=2052148 RepID=A0A7C3N6B2_UNCW3